MNSTFSLNKIILIIFALFTINAYSQGTDPILLLEACKQPNCPYPTNAGFTFSAQGQWGLDPNDTQMAGWSSEASMPDFYSIPTTGDYNPLIVNVMPLVNNTIVYVPLIFYAHVDSDWSISNTFVDFFPTGTTITLIDSANLVETDITNNGATYTFYQTNNSSHATGLGRFYLKFDFSGTSGGINNSNIDINEVFNTWYSDNTIYINYLNTNNSDASFRLVDLYGRTIIQWSNIETNNYQFNFNNSSGIYFLNFKYKDKIFVKKLFVYNK